MSIIYNIHMAINNDIEIRMGAKLAYIRKSKNISQAQLAEDIDVTFQYISQIECGKANPTLEKIINLANALDVDVKELFDFSF